MHKDEPFDRLLNQQLRIRDTAPRPSGCLDAEVLAALVEGSLTPAQRSAAEAHAADCDRCLAMLAAFAKTSPPAAMEAKPSWLSVRWLVPLATAAVAITAWVILQPPALEIPRPQETSFADSAKRDQPAVRPSAGVASEPQPPALEKKTESTAAQAKEQDQSRRNPAAAKNRADVTLDKVESRAPAQAAAPTAARRAEAADERLQRQFAAAAPLALTILSPDAAVRWRIAGRSVERSSDGGKTWDPQSTGTTVDLFAGASPSKDVCWIVGRNGLVLLTTDGTNWRRLPFPNTSVDLAGVRARDATNATVITATGGRYLTTDAGRTWTPQENPPAPF